MRTLHSIVGLLVLVLTLGVVSAPTPTAEAAVQAAPSDVHLFYYPWYGSPERHGSYRHWPQGGHTPPNDIGADFYPTLGAYDSGDPAVLDAHMAWVRRSGAGVIVTSWWGQGSYEDSLVPGILTAAAKYGIKVAWHLEPYSGRTAGSTVADIDYIIARYGASPAFYRDAAHGNRSAFYVFESLRITDWSALDQVSDDAIVLAQTTDTSKVAHFGGMYTYDGIAGATAPGWKNASDYCKANGLVWAPSVAPGYIDDRAVPGNTTPTVDRANGAMYDRQWRNALDPATGGAPTWVSVTSFNEWHEGSILEPARSAPPGAGYLTFDGAYGQTGAAAETAYLDRTRYWVNQFTGQRPGAVIPPGDYQQVQLAAGGAELGEPMSLAVLPNRSVVHTARDGTVRVTDAAGNTTTAGRLNVYTHDEEGLQGVAADPGFATNRHLWLYYSPALSTPGGDAPTEGSQSDWAAWKGELRLSRFVLNTNNTLDLASEKIVLRVANDRGQCCHVGGDLDFDAAGNLYLTTGDDTNPFQSDSYTPIDERASRNPQFDAQRSSGNTNDLRGKVLRIKPRADGTYSVPNGNLFPPGTANTRPEIYAMGFRNPFRMSVDKATGIVYLGDYGPDAGGTNPNRGPGGQVEFNRITGPGNYGWPYCTGTNTTTETYNDYTFPSGPSGAKFDCAGGPVNNSFRNTGQQKLPAVRPAWIRYGGDAGSPPEFGGGSESPMGGPVYRFDPNLNSAVKFPQSLDGRFFAGEYGRQWIKAIEVTGTGGVGDIAAFPWTGTQVMDMAFGPDGALYVLDYGAGSNNQALWRVEHIGGQNRNPVAKAAADTTSGAAPLTVRFSSQGSADPEGEALTYAWDFGDGTSSTAAHPTKTYNNVGNHTATLTVRDPRGLTGSASVRISVGNTAPSVTLTTPGDGALFSFGDTVGFQVNVSDPEDGQIDCNRVKVRYLLGHDNHQHELTSRNGCTGTIATPADGEHDPAANVYGVLDAEYTDHGGLVTNSVRKLQPRHRQGEHFTTQSGGLQLARHGGAEGGQTVGFTDNGEWISFTPYVLSGANGFTARVSSGGPGGTLEVRTGSATGPLLGSVAVANTGNWDTFVDVNGRLTGAPNGTTTLFLVFKGVTGQGNLFDVDAFTLNR